MKKSLYILALIESGNAHQQTFFNSLSHHFDNLFHIEISDQLESHALEQADAIFSFESLSIQLPILYFSETGQTKGFDTSGPLMIDSHRLLKLTKYLTVFYQSLETNFLRYLPLQVRLADSSGEILWTNNQFDGTFFSEDTSKIEDWVIQDLKETPHGSRVFFLPSGSLDHIYVQHYQALHGPSDQFLGVYDQTLDFKPLLKHYLEETGQAIVGWSDVTSGPSISNDD
ncbi:hypothetical protein [Streptococcus phocae]|uniref:Multidrug transporter n=1 Tax=Streptococcus phocae TaxID=119224 RepID=A0A0P6SNW7_9STRE|nr:hypothetical protein [Streptococcus phocae]KPJ23127.1 multidrug transporter [Streptococcus phocae]